MNTFMLSCQHVMFDDESNGVAVCSQCGLTRPIISSAPEWRDSAKERCDMIDAPHEASTDIVGNGLMARMNRSLCRQSRTLYEDAQCIQHVCALLRLSHSICDAATRIISDTRQHCEGVWRGNRRIALRAASISLACQMAQVGITDHEVVRAWNITIPARCLNKQKKIILSSLHQRSQVQDMEKDQYNEFGLRFCSELGFDFQLSRIICNRAEVLSRRPRLQSKPANMILAVVVIHHIGRSHVTAQMMCKAARVTVPTLTKWYADAYNVTYTHARDVVRGMRA